MFDGLLREIEELDVPVTGSSLASLVAARDRLDARIAVAVAALDAAEAWSAAGEGSMAGWLKSQCGMTARAAAAVAGRARTVARLPMTAEAWRRGELSTGQVDAIVGQLGDELVERFAASERKILPRLMGASVRATAAEMVEWRRGVTTRDEPGSESGSDDTPSGSISCVRTEADRGELRGDLDPETRRLFETAIRVASRKDDEGEHRTWGERRHEAFGDILKAYLDNQTARTGGSHRPHVTVVVTQEDALAGRGGVASDGSFVDPVAMSTMMCDCVAHRVTLDLSSVHLDMGREIRTITARQRSGLIVLDGGCRWKGCDRPAEFCDGHHVEWWEHGGRTDLANLTLLCRRHHRTLHKPGWRAELLPDRAFRVTDPDGHTWTTAPPGLVRLRPTG